MSTPGKRAKGKTASLTAMWPGFFGSGFRAVMGEGVVEAFAGHDARRDLGDRAADGLGDEGHGARRARVHFQHEDRAVLDGVLHVHQPADIERAGERRRLALQLVDDFRRQRMDGQRAGAVARMDAGLLDMLHDARDEGVLAVAKAIDVDLDGAGEIGVEEQRVFSEQRVDLAGLVVGVFLLDVLRHQAGHGVEQVGLQHALVVDDLHGAAAEHVGRAHDEREAEPLRDGARLLDRPGDAVLRLHEVEAVQELLEAVAVLGEVDHVGGRAEDRDAGLFQRVGELQRRLSAELHDDAEQLAVGLFGAQDLQHILRRQRLEIEAVRGVVVGRHGLGVAVDHDRLVAGVAQREGGVAAAIVELDALADAVRPAAEDDDFLARRNLRFGAGLADEGRLVGGIHVGGGRGEFGGACVDALVDRVDAEPGAMGGDMVGVGAD